MVCDRDVDPVHGSRGVVPPGPPCTNPPPAAFRTVILPPSELSLVGHFALLRAMQSGGRSAARHGRLRRPRRTSVGGVGGARLGARRSSVPPARPARERSAAASGVRRGPVAVVGHAGTAGDGSGLHAGGHPRRAHRHSGHQGHAADRDGDADDGAQNDRLAISFGGSPQIAAGMAASPAPIAPPAAPVVRPVPRRTAGGECGRRGVPFGAAVPGLCGREGAQGGAVRTEAPGPVEAGRGPASGDAASREPGAGPGRTN